MQNSQNRYKRLGINTIYTFIANVGPQFVSFILVPFYTFWLSKEAFGIQDLFQVYVVFLVPYLSMGLYEAVFLFPKDKPQEEQRQYFSTAIISVTVIVASFILLWLLMPQKVINLILTEKMRIYESFLLVTLATGPYQRIMQNFARSLDKMKVFCATGVVYALLMMAFSLLLVPKYGLYGYFIGFISSQILSTVYTFVGIKGWYYLSVKAATKSRFREMMKFSMPLVPNTTMWWIVNSINRPILLSVVGLEGVGLMAVANKFPSIINVIFSVFFTALQISVIEEFNKGNYRVFYNKIFRVLYFILLGLGFVFILFGDLLFRWFIDAKFHECVYYLPIISLGAIITSLAAYVGSTFTVLKQTIHFLYSSIIAAVVAVAANALLIPKLGIMGACISICLSQLAMFLYRWYKAYKHVNFTNSGRLILITASFLVAMLVYYVFEYSILRQIMLYLLFAVFIYLNIDMYDDMKLILQKVIKRKSN